MSVIVRMEMPENCKSCSLCVFIGASPECALKKYPLDTVSQYYYADKKPSNCPIICSLPEGHGRLIDERNIFIPFDVCDGHEAMGFVEETPTIVPAEAERSEICLD